MSESFAIDFRPPMEAFADPNASVDALESGDVEGEDRKIHKPRENGDDKRADPREKLWETTQLVADGRIDLRLLSFVMLVIAIILVLVFIILDVVEEHREYSRRTGFPGPELFIIGTVISLLVLAYVCYRVYTRNDETRLYIFWFLLLYLLFMMLWIFNLGIRAEKFIRQLTHMNGFNFLFIADLLLLGILVVTYYVLPQLSFLLAIPILWNLFLTYHWLFSVK